MEVIPLSEARRNLTSLVSKLSDPRMEPVVISVRGKAKVAMLSVATLEELQEAKYRDQCHKIFDELDALNRSLAHK
ncbi:MAG: type II toxin-antitoxin system Phd/YefM family antitoxin [Sutterellaceae bacterium]|nr:type II toxin-antitoxin system Phd/YefM family antitoxin [Sutterellaceae bacterium]